MQRTNDLTTAQTAALAIAHRDGIVVAGTGEHAGRVERVNARTLDALIKRGLLIHCYDGNGFMAGRPRVQAQTGDCTCHLLPETDMDGARFTGVCHACEHAEQDEQHAQPAAAVDALVAATVQHYRDTHGVFASVLISHDGVRFTCLVTCVPPLPKGQPEARCGSGSTLEEALRDMLSSASANQPAATRAWGAANPPALESGVRLSSATASRAAAFGSDDFNGFAGGDSCEVCGEVADNDVNGVLRCNACAEAASAPLQPRRPSKSRSKLCAMRNGGGTVEEAVDHGVFVCDACRSYGASTHD